MASFQYKVFSRFMSLIPMKARVNILYFRRFHRFPNLQKPLMFTEKLQLKKLIDRDPKLTIAADKILSKEFVKNITSELYIPKTLWSAKSDSEVKMLDISSLPSNYVYKANHTSQTIEIIKGGKHLPSNKMLLLAQSWFKHDQATALGEWAYQNITPTVFIEEYLDFEGHEPDDYKFFVYHGKVHFIQLDSDRFSNHKRNMFNRDWEDLEINFSHMRKNPSPNRPHFIDDMIKIAESIGAHFDFIRVDLYWYKNMVTFGELTVYPGAGFEKFPSNKWDIEFGKPWVIKNDK